MQIFLRLFLLWTVCLSSLSDFAFCALLKKNPYCTVVVDGKSGSVLGGENFSAPAYPASLTKLMTLLLLFDVLKKQRINLDTLFRVSEKASRQPPCKIGLRKGQKISVQDCILALAVRSANDAAMVVAENLAGSEKVFVKAMNKKAKLIGLRNTFFMNPSGWHHPSQKSTALDMAHLVKHLWKEHPEYVSFLCRPSFSRNGTVYYTTNKLVGVLDGLKISKTGYTGPAGYNLATLTERDHEARIVVIMGQKDRRARDQKMAKIVNLCYSNPQTVVDLFKNRSRPKVELASASESSESFEVAELVKDLLQLSKQTARPALKKKPKSNNKIALKSVKAPKIKKAAKPKGRTKRVTPYIPWDRV